MVRSLADAAREARAGDEGAATSFAQWMAESGREFGHLVVAKFDAEQTEWASRKMGGGPLGGAGFIQPSAADLDRLGLRPYEETAGAFNLITTAGWQRNLTLMIGGGGTSYASASCRIGVGTGSTAPAVGNTDLVAVTGATGRLFKLVTASGALSAGTGTQRLSFTSTFGTGEANIAWNEWCIDQGTVDAQTTAAVATMFNRATGNNGTKVSGQTWTATANLDFV